MNIQKYHLNIRPGIGIAPIVKVSQNDVGRTLEFSLHDNVTAFIPPSGTTVTITGKKPSGLGFTETCTLTGSIVRVSTTLDITQEFGTIPTELRLTSGNTTIGTANFVIDVEKSPHPDGTTDGTHATVDNLQTQIGNLANLTTTAKTNLVSAINEAAQSGGTEVVIDNTLTQTGQAADAKKTGDEISALKADLDDNVNDLKSALHGIEHNVGDAVTEYASAISKQVYYNTQYGLMGIRSTTNFNYHVYEVSAGKKYYVTGYGKSGVNDPIAVLVGSFIESGTTSYIETIDAQTSSNANATVEYTPSADGYLYVNGFAQSDKAELRETVVHVAKIAKQIMSDMYVHRTGNLIEVMCKYSADNDVIYLFNKVGPNSIMQIAGYDKLPNMEMYCSGDFNASRTHILKAGTDWMSPYKVIAVNDADGDGAGQGVNGFYTGGFHAYDNSQSGVATGRTSAYKLFIDNKEIADITNKVYEVTDSVTLEVTNLIQGNNTTKADGTGREILQEKIIYTITPNRIDIVNTITALEDIIISQYYGLQLYLGALGGFSGFSYYGDTVENHDFSVATSYTKEIDSLIGGLDGDANRIVCQLNRKGIGRHQYIKSGGIMARSIAGKKVYNSLVDNSPNYLPLSTGDSVFISGHYAFSENTVNAQTH